MQRASELDPLNDLIQQFYGMTLSWDRRFEEGLAHAERVRRTRHNAGWAARAVNYHWLGRFDEALSAQRNVFGQDADNPIGEALDRGFAAGGYRTAMVRAGEAGMSNSQHGMRTVSPGSTSTVSVHPGSAMPSRSALGIPPVRERTRNCGPCRWMGCAIAMPIGPGWFTNEEGRRVGSD
jgi:hypothetical protein